MLANVITVSSALVANAVVEDDEAAARLRRRPAFANVDVCVDRVTEPHGQREAHVVEPEPCQHAGAEDPAAGRQPEGESERQRPVGDPFSELGSGGILGVDV